MYGDKYINLGFLYLEVNDSTQWNLLGMWLIPAEVIGKYKKRSGSFKFKKKKNMVWI